MLLTLLSLPRIIAFSATPHYTIPLSFSCLLNNYYLFSARIGTWRRNQIRWTCSISEDIRSSQYIASCHSMFGPYYRLTAVFNRDCRITTDGMSPLIRLCNHGVDTIRMDETWWDEIRWDRIRWEEKRRDPLLGLGSILIHDVWCLMSDIKHSGRGIMLRRSDTLLWWTPGGFKRSSSAHMCSRQWNELLCRTFLKPTQNNPCFSSLLFSMCRTSE